MQQLLVLSLEASTDDGEGKARRTWGMVGIHV